MGCKHCRNGFLDNRFGQDVECVNGVLIDIDVFHEGWDRSECFSVAPCHPDWKKQCSDRNFVASDTQKRLLDACHD